MWVLESKHKNGFHRSPSRDHNLYGPRAIGSPPHSSATALCETDTSRRGYPAVTVRDQPAGGQPLAGHLGLHGPKRGVLPSVALVRAGVNLAHGTRPVAGTAAGGIFRPESAGSGEKLLANRATVSSDQGLHLRVQHQLYHALARRMGRDADVSGLVSENGSLLFGKTESSKIAKKFYSCNQHKINNKRGHP